MVDTDTVPVVLAGVGMVGVIGIVVGSSALAARHGGVWAGVTAAAFFVTAVAVVLLYAFGEFQDQARDRRGGR